MAPTRIKRKCCVPYCNNVQEISKKQFFKIGANLEGREKWLSNVGKALAAKSQILYCCEDHFDLPNDAENYIRCKYFPGTKLKLRPNVLPQKKLPLNVCRLCLKLIFNGDDIIEISEKKGGKNADIVASTLPELDLSITVEPVACVKCFDPLQQYYRIKQTALNSEVIVVNCIKSIVKRSPTRLIKNCEIDLFEEYNDIVDLLGKDQENNETSKVPEAIPDPTEVTQDNQEIDRKSTEEIVIHIEELNDDKYHKEEVGENDCERGHNYKHTSLKDKINEKYIGDRPCEQEDLSIIDNMSRVSGIGNSELDHEKTHFIIQNAESLPNISSSSAEPGVNVQYEVVENAMELSSENIYIQVEQEPVEQEPVKQVAVGALQL